MKPNFNDIVRAAKKASMTPRESAAIRAKLVDISSVPVSLDNLSRPAVRSPYMALHYSLVRKVMPIALLVALVVSGGTAAAAESALPGDFLYPVKVHVTEEARAVLTFDTPSRAAWETTRVSRRLEEAGELAAQGKLTPEAEAVLASNIDAHTAKVEEEVSSIEGEGKLAIAADVASNVEATLRVHQQILSRFTVPAPEATAMSLRVEDTSTTPDVEMKAKGGADIAVDAPISVLIKVLENKLEKAATLRLSAETKIASSTSKESSQAALSQEKAARKKIAAVRDALEKAEDSIDADVRAEVEGHLSKADTYMLEAKTQLEANASAEAFKLFSSARHIAQEASIMLRQGRLPKPEKEEGSPEKSTERSTTTVEVEAPVRTLPFIPKPVEIKGSTTVEGTTKTGESNEIESHGSVNLNVSI